MALGRGPTPSPVSLHGCEMVHPMVTQQDTGDAVPPILKGLRAYFSGSIGSATSFFSTMPQITKALSLLARDCTCQPSPLVFPRQIHPAQVVSHAGLAAGPQLTSGPATPLLLPPLLPILYQQEGPALRKDQCLSPPRPSLRSLSSPHLLPTLLNARLEDGPRLGSPITENTSGSRGNSLVGRRVVGGKR